MTTAVRQLSVAEELCAELIAADFGPYFGTPCGVLSPLYAALEERAGLLTVPREDNAIGIAAGASLARRYPVVLMQNSGLGQSVNAVASLIMPYRIPILLIVSVRGIDPDPTRENAMMGRLTRPLLTGLGVECPSLDPDTTLTAQVDHLRDIVCGQHRPAALLVPPAAFGWGA